MYLENAGFEVAVAKDAAEGLAAAEKAGFDAALLDIELPGLSGFQALTRFLPRCRGLVWLMSGHADPELEKDARLLGAAALLRKPLDLRALVEELQARP